MSEYVKSISSVSNNKGNSEDIRIAHLSELQRCEEQWQAQVNSRCAWHPTKRYLDYLQDYYMPSMHGAVITLIETIAAHQKLGLFWRFVSRIFNYGDINTKEKILNFLLADFLLGTQSLIFPILGGTLNGFDLLPHPSKKNSSILISKKNSALSIEINFSKKIKSILERAVRVWHDFMSWFRVNDDKKALGMFMHSKFDQSDSGRTASLAERFVKVCLGFGFDASRITVQQLKDHYQNYRQSLKLTREVKDEIIDFQVELQQVLKKLMILEDFIAELVTVTGENGVLQVEFKTNVTKVIEQLNEQEIKQAEQEASEFHLAYKNCCQRLELLTKAKTTLPWLCGVLNLPLSPLPTKENLIKALDAYAFILKDQTNEQESAYAYYWQIDRKLYMQSGGRFPNNEFNTWLLTLTKTVKMDFSEVERFLNSVSEAFNEIYQLSDRDWENLKQHFAAQTGASKKLSQRSYKNGRKMINMLEKVKKVVASYEKVETKKNVAGFHQAESGKSYDDIVQRFKNNEAALGWLEVKTPEIYALKNFTLDEILTLKTVCEAIDANTTPLLRSAVDKVSHIDLSQNDWGTISFLPDEVMLLKDFLSYNSYTFLSSKLSSISFSELELSQEYAEILGALDYSLSQGGPILTPYTHYVVSKYKQLDTKELAVGYYLYQDNNQVLSLVVHGGGVQETLNLTTLSNDPELIQKIKWPENGGESNISSIHLDTTLLDLITNNCRHSQLDNDEIFVVPRFIIDELNHFIRKMSLTYHSDKLSRDPYFQEDKHAYDKVTDKLAKIDNSSEEYKKLLQEKKNLAKKIEDRKNKYDAIQKKVLQLKETMKKLCENPRFLRHFMAGNKEWLKKQASLRERKRKGFELRKDYFKIDDIGKKRLETNLIETERLVQQERERLERAEDENAQLRMELARLRGCDAGEIDESTDRCTF